jgi:hypothetical protein
MMNGATFVLASVRSSRLPVITRAGQHAPLVPVEPPRIYLDSFSPAQKDGKRNKEVLEITFLLSKRKKRGQEVARLIRFK